MKIQFKEHKTRHVLVILLLTAGMLSGQSYFRGMTLSGQDVYDGRSGGMGLSRTALDQGAWSLTGNPANLNSINGLNASGSLILDQVTEERSIEAIDQFNDVVAKNIYAANTHSFRKFSAAASYGLGQFAIGLAHVPVKDYAYQYSEEIRNSLSSSYYNRDPLAGYHTIEMNGQIMATHMGGSAAFGPIALGASLITYAGDDMSIEKSVSVLSSDDALASDTSYTDRSLHSLSEAGIGFILGASYELNQHLSVHYAFDLAGDLTINSTGAIPFADSTKRYPEYLSLDSSAAFTIETPAVHRFGVAFSPGQKNKTLAVFEIEFHKGQTISYSREIQGLESFDYEFLDTKIIHVGLEHWASPTLPIRMGYSYEESPLDKSLSTTRFTAGGSILYGPFQIDLSGQLASLGYVYPDIFPAIGSSAEALESVNESMLKLYATVSYKMP